MALAPLTPQQQSLVLDPTAQTYARLTAARYSRQLPHLADEIESAAQLGLVQAAGRFDPARRLRFVTFAGPRIVGAIQDTLREQGLLGFRRGRHAEDGRPILSTLDSTNMDSGESADLPIGWEAEYQDQLDSFGRDLTEQQRRVIGLKYGAAGKATLKAIGRSLGLSESRVCQIHADAIDSIRGKFAPAVSISVPTPSLITIINPFESERANSDMSVLQFSLGNLVELDSGKAVTALDLHIRRAALDCMDRPGDGKARKVKLEISLSPIMDDAGECTEVTAQLHASSSVPQHRTKLYSLGLRKNGVLTFNPDAPDNINQTTLMDKED